jgi:hypothetical protein
MSYDLYFYKKKTDHITKHDIEAYLNKLPNLKDTAEKQWFFQNEDSGAYWTFEFYASDGDDLDLTEIEESYEDFEDTNFMFNINFIRPDFFGKEAFPIAEKFAEDLNLFILNPQGEAFPKKYDPGIFENEWMDTNMKYSRTNFDEWGLNYLERNKSDYSWRYNLERKKLQSQYGNEYFVPTIFYVKKHNSRLIETLCMWPEHIPYILPKVDIVLIEKKIKTLFWNKNEEGIIRYSELVDQIGNYFIEEENYMIIHPAVSKKISNSFNRLKLFDTFNAYGEGVSVDKFVNTEPEEKIL